MMDSVRTQHWLFISTRQEGESATYQGIHSATASYFGPEPDRTLSVTQSTSLDYLLLNQIRQASAVRLLAVSLVQAVYRHKLAHLIKSVFSVCFVAHIDRSSFKHAIDQTV